MVCGAAIAVPVSWVNDSPVGHVQKFSKTAAVFVRKILIFQRSGQASVLLNYHFVLNNDTGIWIFPNITLDLLWFLVVLVSAMVRVSDS